MDHLPDQVWIAMVAAFLTWIVYGRKFQRKKEEFYISREQLNPPDWAQNTKLIVTALLLVLIVIGGLLCFGFYMANKSDKATDKRESSFAETRQEKSTKLTKQGPAPQEYDNTPPTDVKVVHYPSGDRELMAWLALPKQGKQPYPIVVFAHGGYALGKSDFDEVQPFVSKGYALLLPTWRGENGNPGNFEMCGGEVEDLVAAIDYVSTKKSIDKSKIFVAGHSIGATNVMLAAELSGKIRKAVACGGLPDMASAGSAYENPPFDDKNWTERYMRSPAKWAKELKCPLLLLYAEKDPGDAMFKKQAEHMKESSDKNSISVEVIPNTDHFTALRPAVSRMISFFESN